MIKTDVLQTKLHGAISTGHNSLAAFIYFFTFLAFVAQSITGFALYSSMSNSWMPRMFTWIVPLMGGEMGVRYWHHLLAVVLRRVHHRSRLSCPSITTTSKAAAPSPRSWADGSLSGRRVTD